MLRASEDFAAMERAAAEEEESGMGGFKHEVAGRRKRKEVRSRESTLRHSTV